jgi:hypothetical protein
MSLRPAGDSLLRDVDSRALAPGALGCAFCLARGSAGTIAGHSAVGFPRVSRLPIFVLRRRSWLPMALQQVNALRDQAVLKR